MKKKFLALTMASAVMLMGAGYAYWTEDLKIANTVRLGALDYQFTVATDPADRIVNDQHTGGSVGYGGNDNILNVSLTNMYPGAESTVKFGMKNNGSIDEVLKDFDFQIHAGDQNEAKFILLKSATVNGADQFGSAQTIADLAGGAPVGEIPIGVGQQLDVELTFQVDKNADYDDLKDKDIISFDIIADVLQYNDKD